MRAGGDIAGDRESPCLANQDFTQLEITVGLDAGVQPNLETVKRFANAGVHRLVVFAPGFIPRSRYDSELFPQRNALLKT